MMAERSKWDASPSLGNVTPSWWWKTSTSIGSFLLFWCIILPGGCRLKSQQNKKICNMNIFIFTCLNIDSGKIIHSALIVISCRVMPQIISNLSCWHAILTSSKNAQGCSHNNSPRSTARDHLRNITAVWKDSWIWPFSSTNTDLNSALYKVNIVKTKCMPMFFYLLYILFFPTVNQ